MDFLTTGTIDCGFVYEDNRQEKSHDQLGTLSRAVNFHWLASDTIFSPSFSVAIHIFISAIISASSFSHFSSLWA